MSRKILFLLLGYFLGKNLTTTDGASCPGNSALQHGQCQCNPPGIFRVSKDNEHCGRYRRITLNCLEIRCSSELILNGTGDSKETPTCNASISGGNDTCATFFGGNARFCREGECRCMLDHSYPWNNACGISNSELI